MSKISKIRPKFARARSVLLAGACVLAVAMPAQAQLEQALRVAQSSTAASAAAQRQVEQSDDTAESAARDYRAVLQQIDNMKLFVDQQDIYLRGQAGDIEALRGQLGSVEQVKRGMVPMMLLMAARIEDSVNADMPFKLRERKERLARLKETLGDPSITPTEQYRQVLAAYKNEVAYGQGMDSYEGAHPSKSGVKVDYLMFGRISLIYMTKDEKDLGYFDMADRTWKSVDSSNALQVRQAIRIANGEAAPEIVFAPVTGAK
ncbi:MAG: DUF3450 domain-containing protein [Robiginitomaculum sp.]|nr:DUF3450 domain-containing protein [Robiginitomaculum sp.]